MKKTIRTEWNGKPLPVWRLKDRKFASKPIGVVDKNGEMLCEGDIIDVYGRASIPDIFGNLSYQVIIYHEDSAAFGFECEPSEDGNRGGSFAHDWGEAQLCRPERWEKVGSIYW